ncbi:hypothetical protein HDU91_004996 [Kappamyces sp. JEL0680]|nr:hypothetical protein HDU91_004996 [Kappamyces sp. JEL0680]
MTSILSWIASSISSTPISTAPNHPTLPAIVGGATPADKSIGSHSLPPLLAESLPEDGDDWVILEDPAGAQTNNTLAGRSASLHHTPGSLPPASIREDARKLHDSELLDVEDSEIDDQASSIATIEHVRVTGKSEGGLDSKNYAALAASLTSLSAAGKERNDRESLKTMPRTTLTLAQLKDKELKMRKLGKMKRSGR